MAKRGIQPFQKLPTGSVMWGAEELEKCMSLNYQKWG